MDKSSEEADGDAYFLRRNKLYSEFLMLKLHDNEVKIIFGKSSRSGRRNAIRKRMICIQWPDSEFG
jgi:hypothetical protein